MIKCVQVVLMNRDGHKNVRPLTENLSQICQQLKVGFQLSLFFVSQYTCDNKHLLSEVRRSLNPLAAMKEKYYKFSRH